MPNLSSNDLRKFLEFVEIEKQNIGAVDCSPNSKDECLASAALLILSEYLPKQIKLQERIELEETTEREHGHEPVIPPENWQELLNKYKKGEITFREMCDEANLMWWQADRLLYNNNN